MARQNIILGEPGSEQYLEFRTKTEARAFFKAMLGRYRSGQTVTEPDASFLENLLERRAEARQKIGVGVKRFYRAPTSHGTDCFWLERHDGSTTDFSYPSCVDGKGKSLYQDFAEACRQAVQPELTRKKKEFFENNGDSEGKVECEATGLKVAIYESHLDHKKPITFQVIVHTFIRANNIAIRPEILSRPSDGQFAMTFTDKPRGAPKTGQ